MTNEILKGKFVTLVPFRGQQDWEYLMMLAEKDEGKFATRKMLAVEIVNYAEYFWTIYVEQKPIGVGLVLKMNDKLILEALKDIRATGAKIKHSIDAGQVMLDYLFRDNTEVYTCARVEDKAIKRLCRRLGFVDIGNAASYYCDVTMFRKEKPKCQFSVQ